MLKKTFISPLFKFPIPWINQYFDNFNALGPDWQHIIFTDLDIMSRGNISVVKMDVGQFMDLVELQTGIRPYVIAPSPKFGDMRPAFGLIFADYLKDIDFWGHTDFDMVMGNLDKYITDEILSSCDIFSDDPNAINGIFTLYRNDAKINNVFKQCPEWQKIFQDERYHAFDEMEFSELIRTLARKGEIRFVDGFRHGNDKYGVGKIEMKDGSLYQNGREIMTFHFRRTKRWPL